MIPTTQKPQNLNFGGQKKIVPLGKFLAENSENSTKLLAIVKKDDKISTEIKKSKLTTLTASQLSKIQGTSVIPTKNSSIVVLPTNFVQQLHSKTVLPTKKKEPEAAPKLIGLNIENNDFNEEMSDAEEKYQPSLNADGIYFLYLFVITYK